jgi:hypothetical protein
LFQASEEKKSFFIFLKDYEAWANDYLGGYKE